MTERPTHHDMTTKELKNALNSARDHYVGSEDEDDGTVFIGTRTVKGGQTYGVYATPDQIRETLNTRPHVPNGKEAKLLRQLMAKTGQDEKWLRSHPKYGMMLVDVQHPNRREVTKEQVPFLKVIYGSLFAKMHKVVKKRR